MATLTYRTAGESHGKGLIALVEGMPAGVPIDSAFIDNELAPPPRRLRPRRAAEDRNRSLRIPTGVRWGGRSPRRSPC
jgi:chorismate synthase